MYFDLGRIRYANLRNLFGKQAVYQIFLSPLQESFIFQGGPLPAGFTDEEEIIVSTAGLLMDSIRLQDELQDLKAEFPDDQRQFKLNIKTLTWENPDTMALARQVYEGLQREDSIARMIEHIPYNEASICMVLSEMQQKGMIA